MLTLGLICTFVAAASAGYASSSSGYAGSGGYAAPVGPFYSPLDFQNQLFQQQLQHQQAIFAQNQAIQNQIQSNIAAISGGAYAPYGGGYGYQPSFGVPNRFGGSSGGSSFATGGAFAGTSGGGSVGSYGGVRPGGQVYGGTVGGGRPQYSSPPNYASSGGSVSSNGHHQQHAAIYPANPARPNLDSRFGDDGGAGGVGVSHTSTGHNPGFVGVSSFSSSSDINGVKNRESGTSVNKGGQVTTYYTRN